MPEMDGWEVARRLRQSSPERTAIVVLSANAIDPSRLLDAERLHDDYLMKPIDLRQLLKTIHALLNIEWIYEPEPESQPVAAIASRPSALPAGSDINELFSLGEIGHVRQSKKSCAASSATRPNARFVEQMRAFVNALRPQALPGRPGGNSQRPCVRRKAATSSSWSTTRPTRSAC